MKIAVDGLRRNVSHACDRTKGICAWPQVCYLAQKLETVLFRLDGVGVRIFNPSRYFHIGSLYLEFLPPTQRFNQLTRTDDRATAGELLYITAIIGQVRWRDNLDVIYTGSVIDGNERKPSLGISTGAHPALYSDL